jgi:hypothetical protein
MPGARRVPVAGVVQAALQALEELSDAGERRERESAAEAKQLTRVLAEPEVEAAARKDKDLAEPPRSARAGASAEAKSAKERTASLEQARVERTKELDALKTLLP